MEVLIDCIVYDIFANFWATKIEKVSIRAKHFQWILLLLRKPIISLRISE